MITSVSAMTATAVMDLLQSRCQWASLHHDTPDFASPGASELQFGGYSRQEITWEKAPNGWYSTNLQKLSWHGLVFPAKVMAVGLWDLQFKGELQAFGLLTEVSRVTGSVWSLDAGVLVLRLATGL